MLGLWLALAVGASPNSADVELTAERVLHDGKKDLSTAEGKAKLVTEGAAIDADRIVYDRNKNLATATGHVVARIVKGGRIAVVADLMTLLFDDEHEVREIYLFDGQAVSKKDVSVEALLAADTAEAVEKVGTTQALLQGNHLVRSGTTRWTIDELELVPCECDFKNPSWSITSSESTVDTEAERVSINNPVFRVKHVPVLWLPWLSLPLTDRQSGLLFTRPNYGPQNGFTLDQPVYLTLGRSADLTLTPGFFTGSPGTGAPGTQGGPSPLGVAGPRLSTEFRYVPSSRATGRVVLGLLYDFRDKRDVENGALREIGTQRGLRGELGWQHTQDFDKGFGARVDLNVHSDGDYNRDLVVDVIASTATYLRSTAVAFHRGADHYIGLDVGLRQDIEWGYDLLGSGTLVNRPQGYGRYGPGTLQRLPAFTFGWAPTKLLGPLRFDVEGDAVRLAPLFSNTGDEGMAASGGAILHEPFAVSIGRFFTPGASRADGTGDRIWQLGEREARDRLMVLPRLSVSAQPLGGAFSVSAFAGWRQFGWLGEASGRSWSRGYLLLGGRLETELSRSFGAVRHVIQPLAEIRAIPLGLAGAAGSSFAPATTAPVPYDAVDAAVPGITPRFQGVLELRQRLLTGGTELVRLDVGQGFELAGTTLGGLAPTLGESYGRLATRIGWFSAQGTIRLDPLGTLNEVQGTARLIHFADGNVPVLDGLHVIDHGGLTRLAARADLDDYRGHGAYVEYQNLLMEGSARSRQPIDLLFLIDRVFTSVTRVRQVVFGARWDFGPIALRYDALVSESVLTAGTAPVLVLAQHTLGVGIAPACDCWRLDLLATQRTFPAVMAPTVGFNVTISKFGSIGR